MRQNWSLVLLFPRSQINKIARSAGLAMVSLNTPKTTPSETVTDKENCTAPSLWKTASFRDWL